MKQKYGRKKGNATSSATAKDLWACPTFHITRPAGEDDRTRDLYIAKLRKEYGAFPTNRNSETIKQGMDITLYHRREMIKAGQSIKSILDIYPILGDGEEVREASKHHYIVS